MKKINVIALVSLLFCCCAYGQIVINEYSASNLDGYLDNYNKYEDWIELYNTGSTTVNLEGYYLSDDDEDNTKWEIPAGTYIAPNGYVTIWCSGRNEKTGNSIHSNFKLKQTKETEHLVLSLPNGTVINDIELQKTQLEHSWGRSPNGSSNFKIFTNPTLGAANNTPSFTRYAKTPEMDLEAGFYDGSQTLTITTDEDNSTIYYSVNGDLPDNLNPTYTSPLTINDTQVIKAIVTSPNPQVLPSFISFNTYFIDESHTLPIMSASADQLYTLMGGDASLRPHGTVEYFTPDGERKDAGYGEFNKHGQDSWAFNQRSLDYIARDEMGYHAAIEEKLIKWSDRDSYQRIMFRASGDDNYPSIDSSAHIRDVFIHNLAAKHEMKVDMRRGERCVVYINGDYWGVYSIREKVSDSDYTNYYYGQDKYNIQYLMNWAFTWAQYGGNQAFIDWDNIHDFAMNNDLSIESNYMQVANEIDVESLTDYVLINSFAVCTDWINWNTSWWRGLNPEGGHTKWGYVLWDEDATFNHYINYTGVPNENPDADPCYPEGITADPEEQIVLLNKLLESDIFRQYYITRYMDLMNTVFTEAEAIGLLEEIEAEITPEMPKHFLRWGGNMNEWQANVKKIKDFISDRVDFVPQGLNDCYSLTGPYNITLNVSPANAGQIKFNSLTIDYEDYPWTGSYHGGIDMISASVESNQNYIFDHWQLQNQSIVNPNDPNISFELTQDDVLTAVFVENTALNDDIVINEINYKDSEDFEVGDWVELYNKGSSAVDLSNWVFKDDDDTHEFILPAGTSIPAGGYVVLAKTLSLFQTKFPSVSPVYGDFGFGLSGGGELIRLFDADGNLVDSVTYDDEDPWPTEPDGNGPTLELINPSLDNSLPESWDACAPSGSENGTPGAVNNDCSLGVEDFNTADISIVPNPMQNETVLRIPNNTISLNLRLYDMLGRVVQTATTNTDAFIIKRGNLNTGIYLIQISSNNKTSITKKLIVK